MSKEGKRSSKPRVILWIVLVVVAWAIFCVISHLTAPALAAEREPHWTEVSAFFTVLGALFAGFAVVGVWRTLQSLIDQVRISAEEVRISVKQAEIAKLSGERLERQNLFLSLSDRVSEVIGNGKLTEFQRYIFPPRGWQISLREIQRTDGAGNDEFVDILAKGMSEMDLSDGEETRRQNLFKALDRLVQGSDELQQALFKEALNAQIHDSAARMLIAKSIFERDTEMLKRYARLGISFKVLQKDCQDVATELEQRFAAPESVPPPEPKED